jgi:primosomal protein N'
MKRCQVSSNQSRRTILLQINDSVVHRSLRPQILVDVQNWPTSSLYSHNATYFWDCAVRSLQQLKVILSQKGVFVRAICQSCNVTACCPVAMKTLRFFYKYEYNLLNCKLCNCNSMINWDIVSSQCLFINLRKEQNDFVVCASYRSLHKSIMWHICW